MTDRIAHTLGIDVGTSGVRVAAIDRNRDLIAIEGAPLPQRRSPGATVRQRPVEWVAALKMAFSALAATCELDRIAAVSVDGTSGTMLAVDDDGKAVGDALMYDDASGAGYAAAIRDLAPPQSAAHGATSALARAQWIRHARHPKRLLHQADWIAGLLCGRFDVSDESNALKTGYDPVARAWPDWIEAFSPSLGSLLPEVVPVGSVYGVLNGPLARDLGLPRDAVCIAGCTDGCAAVLAAGASETGDAVTALGSTLTLKILSDTPVFSPEFGIYSHRLGERWLPGGASNAGGAAIADALGIDRMRALDPQIDTRADSGLDLYPSRVRGERFPVADPDHAPRMGPRPDDDALFLQGLYEGLARVEAKGYDRLSAAGAPRPRRIFSLGGGTKSAALTAIRRRILPAETVEARSSETAVGMAIHAARSLECR